MCKELVVLCFFSNFVRKIKDGSVFQDRLSFKVESIDY